MSKKGKAVTRDIVVVLHGHLGQRTVLGVAIPVLKGHIASLASNRIFDGLTEREIVIGFRELASQFITSDYHPTYIQRRLGPSGFLELKGKRYRFRNKLIANKTQSELELLQDELIASLRTAYEERQAVISRIEQASTLPSECIEERYALVDAYLSQIAGNRGEMFEVVSFAVLREYFRSFGFSLQRFSTIHANDGGMDFVGGEAIYQVTTDESVQKLRKDLSKSPGTKRVLVRPTVSDEIASLREKEILEIIELKDLLQHFIGWLLSRDKRAKEAGHLQRVLNIALEEFQRENRAELPTLRQ